MMEELVAILICDADGRVRSASRGAGAAFGDAHVEAGLHVGEALASSPKLRDWVATAIDKAAAGDGDGDSCVLLEDVGEALEVFVVPLADPGGDAFAVVASRTAAAGQRPDEVSQKTWHDIKNQLGGLKLYATFLKKKLGDEEGTISETAGRIVSGIDAVVRSIAEARRGEGNTKGDGQ